MLFRLKKRCGSHRQDGKTYTAGDTIKTTIDLIALFPSKFERVYKEELSDTESDEPKLKKPNIPPSVDVNKEGEDETNAKTSSPSKVLDGEHGKDVTSEFSIAEKAGVKVFEKKNWFVVIDETDGELLNEKKLREKDVEAFLTQYLNDDEDEDDDDDDDDDED